MSEHNPLTPNGSKLATVLGVIAGLCGCAIYFMDLWPAPLVNEFQASMFDGKYYPKLSMLILMTPLLLLSLGIVRVAERVFGWQHPLPPASRLNDSFINSSSTKSTSDD